MAPDPTKNSKPEPNQDMDSLDSLWDDIQLTPVTKTGPDEASPQQGSPSLSDLLAGDTPLKEACQNISRTFRDLDDSFMYLGVLKKLSLPDSHRLFEEKFFILLKLFENAWDNQAYPEKDLVFSMAGEDYNALNKLIHSGDAIQPIYEGLRDVYTNVEQLKRSGVSLGDAMNTLKTLFKNRKQAA